MQTWCTPGRLHRPVSAITLGLWPPAVSIRTADRPGSSHKTSETSIVKQKSGPGADDLAASLGLVAGVRLPWRVSQHAVDSTARSVHLWVTQEPEPPAEVRRPWFGFGRVVMAPRPAIDRKSVV